MTRWIYILTLRLRSLFRKHRVDHELDAELRFHLENQVQQYVMQGMSLKEARSAVMQEFGGVEQVKEECRDMRRVNLIENLVQDLGYALHMLRRNPGFTAAGMLALALGIGANTAIFSFADVILTRPVALPELHRLISVVERRPPSRDDEPLSPANYLDLKAAIRSVDTLAAYEPWNTSTTVEGEPVTIRGVRVTASFAETLGVKPALGRWFFAEEEEPGKKWIVVLSDGFWKRTYGGDPEVLGRILQLDNQRYTIVGVMPGSFRFPVSGEDFWTPLAMGAAEKSIRGDASLYTVGRLRPEMTVKQAHAEIETLWSGLVRQYPEANTPFHASAILLRDHIVTEDHRPFVWFLVGVVGLVLMIACANVANLQLARAAGRHREIALRAALGAGRGRIVRQLLTESTALSAGGAALGLMVAVWGLNLLRSTMPPEISAICDLNSLKVDGRALLFTLGLAVVAGMFSGIAPAWQNSRAQLNDTLNEGGLRATGGRNHRWRDVFVVAQVALALILLIGTGLMVKGFAALATSSPELQPRNLLTFTVELPKTRYPELSQVKRFHAQALEKIKAYAHVQSAAVISGLPYSFYDDATSVSVDGQPPVPANQLPTAMRESINGGYFRTMHIALRKGREFDRHDTASAPPVGIVSESMARRLWPGRDPVGRRLKLGSPNSDGEWITIVGMAADVRHEVYDRSFRSILYRPFEQAPLQAMDFAVRTLGDPMQLAPQVRAALSQIDKNLPAERIETMDSKIHKQASSLRYVAGLMGVFGLVALVLAATGVYAVMAHWVVERRHEIGIRMALGARPEEVLRTVMARGLTLILASLAIGIPLALALSQMLSSLMYGVSAWDFVTFTAVSAVLSLIALAASYIPARRATRVDPMLVLRYE